MDALQKLLETRRYQLESLVGQLIRELSDAPAGALRISHANGCPQYFYRCNPKDSRGTYIRKNDSALAYALAQKDYNTRLLRAARAELAHTVNALASCHPDKLVQAYTSLSPARRKMVRPYIQPKELLVQNWLSEKYDPKPFLPGDPEIYTERRERVRSKSEKMIADKLALMGIPYRYEAPLQFDRFTTIFPDFTLFHADSGKELYLEHNGMMDDSGYSTKAVRRINNYIRHGIFPGDRLMLTFETSRTPLDMQDFESMILHWFSLL